MLILIHLKESLLTFSQQKTLLLNLPGKKGRKQSCWSWFAILSILDFPSAAPDIKYSLLSFQFQLSSIFRIKFLFECLHSIREYPTAQEAAQTETDCLTGTATTNLQHSKVGPPFPYSCDLAVLCRYNHKNNHLPI